MVNKIIKTILRFFFHDDNETEVIHKEKTISLSTQERDIKRKDDALKKIKYLKQNALSDKQQTRHQKPTAHRLRKRQHRRQHLL